MNLYTRYSEYVLYVSYACMRTQLASPAESGMTIILERLCIIQQKPYAREINHICNTSYYYMICKKITCTEIVISTHRLLTQSRSLNNESSLATTGICNCELPWTSMVFQAVMYIKTEPLL